MTKQHFNGHIAPDHLYAGKHTFGVTFEIKDHDKDNRSPVGPATLYANASREILTQPGIFGLEGVVTAGRDIGRPASDDYTAPDPFSTVEKVTVGVHGTPHRNPQREAEMAQRRD